MTPYNAQQTAAIRACMARHIDRRKRRTRIAILAGAVFGLAASAGIAKAEPMTGAELAQEIGQAPIYQDR